MSILRPYQKRIIDKTRDAFRQKHKGVLIQAPTGSGKTVIFSNIVTTAKSPVWVLVNRIELLTSTVKTLGNVGVVCSELHPKSTNFDRSADVVVAMVQTFRNRKPDVRDVGIVIIDECHLTDFDDSIDRFKNAYRIGFTATPKRSGRQRQLTDFYSIMISEVTIKSLITDGFLVDCQAFTYNMIDTTKIKITAGDFNESAMFDEFNKSIIYAGVVNNWKRLSAGLRTIVFCSNIEHAKKTAESFNQSGIKAKYIVSTENKDRDATLAEWRAGEFDVLVNASIFTTGFDEPSIRCVVLLRATTSENLYFQMIGRGSRPFAQKDCFVLLDFGENIARHGAYSTERTYSLTHKTRKSVGAPVMKECKKCGSYLIASAKICEYCGHVFPLTEKEIVEIELMPFRDGPIGTFDVNDVETMEKIRKARGFKLGWIARQIILKEPKNARTLIAKYAKHRGFSSGWAAKQFEFHGI